MNKPSVRAEIITRRTYNRPLNDEGTLFETWEDTINRVISHQDWLWSRSLNRELNNSEWIELETKTHPDIAQLNIIRKKVQKAFINRPKRPFERNRILKHPI